MYKDVILASLYHLFQQELKDKKENGTVQQESKEGYDIKEVEISRRYKNEEKKEQTLASKITQKCLGTNLQISKIKVYFKIH